MKKLVIFGTGDIARLAHYYFTTDSKEKPVAFCVDREFIKEALYLGLPVVAFDEVIANYPPSEHKMFIALSYIKQNKVRAAKYFEAKLKGYELTSYVSSRCTYLAPEVPGDNCFILEDNTIQPFVKIGNNITLWSGNHIGHDAVIEDHCFIASHVVVSGYVHIEAYCFIGVNATLRNSIRIGAETVIGAGAIIMKSTESRQVYLPERAKLFSKTSDQIEL